MAQSRRALVRVLAAGSVGAVGGCLSSESGGSASDDRTANPPANKTTTGESYTASATRTDEPRPPFDGLEPSATPERCVRFDYASYATTPVPSPTPGVPETDTAAVELAAEYERAYLRNWVVLTYDPVRTTPGTETTVGATANPPVYPAVSAEYATRRVLQRTTDGVVVHLQYERSVGGENRETEVVSRYTVNYYLTEAVTVRAETTGYRNPGPHPTDEGVRLMCE